MRPIIFSSEMVRAILNGRKSATRRVIKPQPVARRHDAQGWELSRTDAHRPVYPPTFAKWYSPYGQPGDTLWLRETHFIECDSKGVCYRERGEFLENWTSRGLRWRSPIHMPRWASRITLEITGVRVERLQEISEEDAKAEGVEPGCLTCGENCTYHGGCGYCRPSYRDSFIWRWGHLNAKRGFAWDVNPWVWVIEFRRVQL